MTVRNQPLMWVLPAGARGPEQNTPPPRDCHAPQITVVVGVTMQSLTQVCDGVYWFILTHQEQVPLINGMKDTQMVTMLMCLTHYYKVYIVIAIILVISYSHIHHPT